MVSKRRANASAQEASRVAKLEQRLAELQESLVRARRVGDALRRVGMAVGAGGEDLLELVVATTTEVLDAERATLYLREGERLVSRIKNGGELETITVELGQGIAGSVAESGRSVRVRDAYRDRRFDASWDRKSGYRTRSILAVPIKDHEGETIGVLQVLNKRGANPTLPVPFTRYDEELLAALATQAAVSLDNARLIQRLVANNAALEETKQRLERSLRDLALLYELETAMGRSETIKEMARHAITLTARACGARAGALLHDWSGRLTLYVVNMKHPEEVRQIAVQPGETLAGRAMDGARILYIDDVGKLRDPERVRRQLGLIPRSVVAAPLSDGQHVNGALALYNHHSRKRFREEDGALLKLVSANVTTELKVFESRRERERAERLSSIGRLLSGVMHDLRTPLTVISGYVQLMAVSDDPVLRSEYVKTISEQFEVIGAMQRDLLAYARGETSLLVRKVYMSKFFDDLARQFRPELERRGIVLAMDVRDSGVAFFDEQRMARAMGNLIRNSIEAMPSGGELVLGCESVDDDLLLSVADTGKGIPKRVRSRIFEPFVTAGKKMGTGLGLANVKKIVDEHGGEIAVRSSRKGTRFDIRLAGAMQPHSMRSPLRRRADGAGMQAKA